MSVCILLWGILPSIGSRELSGVGMIIWKILLLFIYSFSVIWCIVHALLHNCGWLSLLHGEICFYFSTKDEFGGRSSSPLQTRASFTWAYWSKHLSIPFTPTMHRCSMQLCASSWFKSVTSRRLDGSAWMKCIPDCTFMGDRCTNQNAHRFPSAPECVWRSTQVCVAVHLKQAAYTWLHGAPMHSV